MIVWNLLISWLLLRSEEDVSRLLLAVGSEPFLSVYDAPEVRPFGKHTDVLSTLKQNDKLNMVNIVVLGLLSCSGAGVHSGICFNHCCGVLRTQLVGGRV